MPTEPLPPLSCDCHMHVFGAPEQYPPSPTRSYTPTLLPQYLAMAHGLGLQRVVFVQPSASGADNSCMLDALRAVPDSSRGVAEHAVAQAQHGSAPALTGRDVANPSSLIGSAAMLLAWLGSLGTVAFTGKLIEQMTAKASSPF